MDMIETESGTVKWIRLSRIVSSVALLRTVLPTNFVVPNQRYSEPSERLSSSQESICPLHGSQLITKATQI